MNPYKSTNIIKTDLLYKQSKCVRHSTNEAKPLFYIYKLRENKLSRIYYYTIYGPFITKYEGKPIPYLDLA